MSNTTTNQVSLDQLLDEIKSLTIDFSKQEFKKDFDLITEIVVCSPQWAELDALERSYLLYSMKRINTLVKSIYRHRKYITRSERKLSSPNNGSSL